VLKFVEVITLTMIGQKRCRKKTKFLKSIPLVTLLLKVINTEVNPPNLKFVCSEGVALFV
jgi:hypothetical protein